MRPVESCPVSVGAVRGRLATDHTKAAVEACVAGLGFGSFLIYQVAEEVERSELRLVLEEFEREPVPVHVVYAATRHVTRRQRALLEILQNGLRELLRPGDDSRAAVVGLRGCRSLGPLDSRPEVERTSSVRSSRSRIHWSTGRCAWTKRPLVSRSSSEIPL